VIYELLKTAHITFMVIWMSGMVFVTLFLSKPLPEKTVAIRRYDRKVTTPAMILTWMCGAGLSVHASWFGANWLWVKLILVVALSALHGMLVGRLRRSIPADGEVHDQAKPALIILLYALLASVVWLVIAKPF
jgi:putative membrane protein